MLRHRQTNAFAEKVARLFEKLMPKAELQARPLLATVHQNFYGDTFANAAPLAASRRRRLRRARMANEAKAVRASWF